MRRTVTILTTFLLLFASTVYAVDTSKDQKDREPQETFKGQEIEPGAVFLKGPDLTPNAIQREDLPGISQWGVEDYLKATPKNKHNALLNMGSYQSKVYKHAERGVTIIGEGEKNSETRTAPINTWTKEQYLNITPPARHKAINNMQKEPLVAPGGETNAEKRTKSIDNYSQEELLNITPEHRHGALTSTSRSFRVGGRSHNNTTITLDPDSWYSEASWNLYDSTAGAYYYTAAQTFSSSAAVAVTLNLLPGSYSVDVWDSYGDGGTSGSVVNADETELVSWTSSSYSSFGQFGFTVTPPQFDVTITLDPDSWYSEASWNLYDSTAGAYYYTAAQTFSSSTAISVTLALAGGTYSVDVWDSYGDGGTSGSVADAGGTELVSWTSSSYSSFGQFGFAIGLFENTITLDPDSWYSEASWNLYDSTAGAYYYTAAQTFSSSAAVAATLPLAAGHYSVDVWDSYGDGGTSGSVADAGGTELVSWTSSSYSSFGQFGFEVLVPSNVPGLIFSEYIEGSSNNKAIELYNASTETINLDEYQIGQTSNGSTAGVWEYFHVFPTGATLAAGDVWVIANSSTSSTYFDTSNADEVLDYPSVVHHNGDDARSILRIVGTDTVVVDLIGETGPDPGSGWDVAGVADATKDHTLIRKADVVWGNDNWTSSAGTDSVTSEWLVHDQNYFTNLGGHPGDPCWDNAINLSVSSVSYGSEINYMLLDASGDTLASCFGCMANNQTNSHDLCLDDGEYVFWGRDAYGDSWNGGSFSITGSDGSVILTGAVESSDGQNWVAFPFAINVPSFSAADLGFGTVPIGSSVTDSITVSNAGYGALATMTISAVTSSSAAFVVTDPSPITLAGGASVNVPVVYTATAESAEAGDIVFTHDGASSPDSVHVTGAGIDAIFYENFNPWTGSATTLPMSGWTILDNNGDAATIPEYGKTWYHDQYGYDPNGTSSSYTLGNGNMRAYMGSGNSYSADETLITPMITVADPAKVVFYAYTMYDRGYTLDIAYSTDGVTYTDIASKDITVSYAAYEAILPATGDQYISFTFAPPVGGSYTYFSLDEVSVSALPNTHISGLATDSETGAALENVAVNISGNIVYTDAAGAYALYGLSPSSFDLGFSKDGYNDASFYVEVALGDSIVQNVALAPETLSDLYATGFEVGDDVGSTQIVSGYDFAVLDTMFNAAGDTILPAAGAYMLAYPDTAGANYNNNDLVFWISDSVVDITSFGSLQMTLDANYNTESNWDYFYVGLLLDDGVVYYGTGTEITGSSNGWVELNLDMSWALGLSTTATPVIWFSSDASVNGYWGGAFDNVSLSGNEFFLAPVTNLVAGSYGTSIPLSWDAPSPTGQVSYDLHHVELANIHNLSRPMFTDENGQTVEQLKGPLDYEALTVEHQYSTAASRSLSHYNVFRQDWPFGVAALHDTTLTNSYDDAGVSDGDYVNYAVSAIYDEGTSVSSGWVAARAGLPTVITDDVFGGEDFEGGFAFENWEQFNSTTAAQWVVGDSAAADSAFGIGAAKPAPSHTNFAFISDGRAGEADFQSLLISPFLDFLDNHTAILKVAAYAQVYASSAYTPCYVLVRANMGPWYTVVDFSFDHNNGWDDYSVSIGDIVGGSDYVQIAVTYGHLGGWNSGYGNGIAIDDLTLDISPGPHSLTLTPTTDAVNLSWTHPDSTMNLLRDPADISPDRQITALATDEDLLDLSDDRTDCFTQGDPNSGWITGFYGPDSGGVTPPTFAALHTFNPGPMALEEVVIHGYYNTDDTTTARADVFVGVADLNGTTTDTIATGISFFDIAAAGSWALGSFDLTGLTYNATDSTYLKVAWTPLDTGYIALFGAHMWIPGQKISDPAIDPGLNGLSGYDSSGVYTPAVRSWVIEVCGTPTPPAISYNVYKDGVLTIDGLEATTWADENVSVVTEACYWVSGVVPMSFNMGLLGAVIDVPFETEPSNVECASAVNQPPGSFSLLTPAEGDTIMITPDNIGSSQLFAWTSSVDPNGSPVEYEVCINIQAPFDQWCDDNGSGTSDFVSLADMASYIDSLMQAGASNGALDITWTVYASDGQAETEASNGPRALHIDAGYALGINDDLLPGVFALHQNYPNPFNPVTTIRFDVPKESHVQMDVYNILGQRIRTLVNGTMQPGFHSVSWNGTNDMGKPLASGMYIYRIHSSEFTAVKKLVLMK